MIRYASSPARSKAVRAVGFPWLSWAEGSFEGEEAERVQSIYSSKNIWKWVSLLFSSRAVSHQSGGGGERGRSSYVNVNEDQERCEDYNHRWTSATVRQTSEALVPSAVRSIRFMRMIWPLKHTSLRATTLSFTFDIHLDRCSNILSHDEYEGLQVISDVYIMNETGLTLTWLMLV